MNNALCFVFFLHFRVFVLVTFFSQYAPNLPFTCFPDRWQRRITQTFQMFPVLISVVFAWSLCAILTATDALPNDPDVYGYEARTDIKLETLAVTPWARFPYPFQVKFSTDTSHHFFCHFSGFNSKSLWLCVVGLADVQLEWNWHFIWRFGGDCWYDSDAFHTLFHG